MQTRLALLATTTLAALAIAAPAEAAGGWYATVTGGANWVDDNNTFLNPVALTTLTWLTEADTGFVIAGAVGMNFGHMMSGLRGEVELSWRQNNVDGLYSSNILGPTPFQSGTIDYDHETFAVLANIWWDIPVGGFSPYIGGGIGWADTSIDGAYTCTGGGACPVPAVVPFDFSDDGFAWQLGAGINFQISPNVKLGVGYRFFQGPEVVALAPNPPPTNPSAHDLDNDNHAAVVTLTFGM